MSKLIEASIGKKELFEIAINRALAEVRINWPGYLIALNGVRQSEDGGFVVSVKVEERGH